MKNEFMNKKIFLPAIVIIVGIIAFFVFNFFIPPKGNKEASCPLEKKTCSDGTVVQKAGPNCEFEFCPGEKDGILVSTPKRNGKIKSPLLISGEAKGDWFFEAEFTAELYDANNNLLGKAILTAKDDWMTPDFVPFEGELNFKKPSNPTGFLRFLNANPSGMPEYQKVFEEPIEFE
jgi:hypothetical protein